MVPESRIYTNKMDAVAKLGTYPFNRLFRLGCGGLQLGDAVNPQRLQALPSPPPTEQFGKVALSGQSRLTTVGAVDVVQSGSGARLQGWGEMDGGAADCVLLEEHGVVVGGGVTQLPRADLVQTLSLPSNLGWAAVAGPGVDPQQVDVLLVRGAHRVVIMHSEEN
jgi:hypothetical protein